MVILVSIDRVLNNEYLQLSDKLYLKYAPTSCSPQRKTKDFKAVKTCRYFGKLNRNELNCRRLHEIGKRRKDKFVNVYWKTEPLNFVNFPGKSRNPFVSLMFNGESVSLFSL